MMKKTILAITCAILLAGALLWLGSGREREPKPTDPVRSSPVFSRPDGSPEPSKPDPAPGGQAQPDPAPVSPKEPEPQPGPEPQPDLEPQPAPPPENPDTPPAASTPVEPKPPENQKADPARQAYADALTRLLEEHVYPDGRPDGFTGEFHSMDENRFCIYDVDRDGREELVLKFLAGEVDDHRAMVLDYDEAEGRLWVQLDEYPSLAFFENGAVLVHWAYNQGRGGAFWPYSLYVYRPESDSYSFVGSVDAWDRTIDTDQYPYEVDVSQTGFVYYLSTGGAPSIEPVDDTVYQQWLAPYVGDAHQAVLTYHPLTQENIRQITDAVTQTGAAPTAP